MFRLHDDNRDRKLTEQEFENGLRDYGLQLTREEFSLLFKSFDQDSNGKINYEEFLRAIRVSACVKNCSVKYPEPGKGHPISIISIHLYDFCPY